MDLYEQNLSDVTLNKRRLKQLDQIFIEELQEIKEDMKYQKKAAFNKVFKETYQETPSAYRKKKKETVDNQESMLENYILQ